MPNSPRCFSAALVAMLCLAAFVAEANAQVVTFAPVTLSGANEIPPTPTTATGTGLTSLNTSTNLLSWTLSFTGLSSAQTAAHYHDAAPGTNGPVTINIGVGNPASGSITLTPTQLTNLLAGRFYFNVHTQLFPGGEIRGPVIPPLASVTSTGTGCSGVSLSAVGLPRIPNASFALTISGAALGSNTYLFGAFGLSTPPVAIGGGCNIYLDLNSLNLLITAGISPLGPVPAPAGTANFPLPIGPSLGALGAALDLQGLAVDSLGGIATTNALSLKIGM